MTVEQLIEKLRHCNPKSRVVALIEDDEYDDELQSVSDEMGAAWISNRDEGGMWFSHKDALSYEDEEDLEEVVTLNTKRGGE